MEERREKEGPSVFFQVSYPRGIRCAQLGMELMRSKIVFFGIILVIVVMFVKYGGKGIICFPFMVSVSESIATKM